MQCKDTVSNSCCKQFCETGPKLHNYHLETLTKLKVQGQHLRRFHFGSTPQWAQLLMERTFFSLEEANLSFKEELCPPWTQSKRTDFFFSSFSSLSQSLCHGRVIMKGCVQWNSVNPDKTEILLKRIIIASHQSTRF